MIAADYEFPRYCVYERDAVKSRKGVVHSIDFVGQNNTPFGIIEDQTDGKFYLVAFTKITMVKHDT